MLSVIFLQILAASAFIFCKKLAVFNSPFFVAGLRMLLAGLILLLIDKISNKQSILKIIKKEWKLILIASTINTYIPNAFGQYGIDHLSPTIVSFIYNLTPFITAILSYVFLAEKISFKKWIGLLIGFLGFIPILLQGSSDRLHFSQNLFPQFIVIVSTISGSYGWILIKQIVSHEKINIFLINSITLFFGGIFSLFTSIFFEKIPALNNINLWTYSLLIAFITHIFWYNMYSVCLKKYSTTFMSFTNFITTIFTALFAIIFLKEKISIIFIISVIIIIIGLYIFYTEEKSQLFCSDEEY